MLSIGYSPCPNDTYIMAALAQKRIETSLDFQPVLADVQTLNQWALEERLQVTKLSFMALGLVRETYGLLYVGSALGRGCGPLVVTKPGHSLADLGQGSIAAPGELTTACLLLSIFLGRRPNFQQMVYSDIMPAVVAGRADYGLIIHESRFTYQQFGLTAILDLGNWWEQQTNRPIPLGCMAIRRELGQETARLTDQAIYDSLRAAKTSLKETMSYVLAHSQEIDPAVVQKHIDLYVNDFSLELADEGLEAIETLFRQAGRAGLLPPSSQALLAY